MFGCCIVDMNTSTLRIHARLLQGCKPDTNRLTERAVGAAQAWIALHNANAKLLCTGFASQAGRVFTVRPWLTIGLWQLRYGLIPAGLPAEANLLAAQAVLAGVPSHSIIIENQARNTVENALLCLPLFQQHQIKHITLVTSDYHMPRSRLLFELVLRGTDVQMSWAEVSWITSCLSIQLC